LTRDERYMRLALRLAARARGRTSPNPMVGAVVVRRGEIVGRGFHRKAGDAHAEVVALVQAGTRARGAELFVNLEPCNHVGRTGPCVRCVLDAGVARVVVGMRDPNPKVDGKGLRALRRAGVEVVAGVLERECRELNEAFVCYITRQRPFVTWKSAITLDGRVATRSGDSRWVTGEAARLEGHRLRDVQDTILVGVGTVLADDPELTCRLPKGRDPIRVIVDSHLRTPTTARVVGVAATSQAPTWIVCGEGAPERRRVALEKHGARVIPVGTDGRGRVSVAALLRALALRDVSTVLLEGGPTLAGSFWRDGVIDRVVAFVAPKLLGDPAALPMLDGAEVTAMADARSLRDVRTRLVGEDLMVAGRVTTD
jgi:diaminohydroxyphosphoribosylaminopyrimidine deaminase / 5-amino-6-(5-phosphoribosylamino)uracil reductase